MKLNKVVICVISIFSVTSLKAMDHADVIKQMKQPKGDKEVMSVSPLAHPIPIDELFPLKPTPTPSASPRRTMLDKLNLINQAYAFSPAKPILPTSISLRQFDTPIQNQWNGTCTAHATVAAIENLIRSKTKLSERFHWSKYERYSTDKSLEAATKSGIAYNTYWPHNFAAPPKPIPSTTQLTFLTQYKQLNTFDELKAHLALNLPAVVAMTTPKDMLSCLSVVRESTEMDLNSGHAIAVVGYGEDLTLKGKGYFEIKNSWSAQCGDKGYQFIPYSVCQKPGAYCAFYGFTKAVLR